MENCCWQEGNMDCMECMGHRHLKLLSVYTPANESGGGGIVVPKPGMKGIYPKGLVAAALHTSYGEIP